MGSNKAAAYGAVSREEGLRYDAEQIERIYQRMMVVGKDPASPYYDPRINLAINERTVKSILRYGVRKPIEIHKNGIDRQGEPVIDVFDGRQRVKHIREANRRLKAAGKPTLILKAVVALESDDDTIASVGVITNEHHFVDSPIVRAQKMLRHKQLYGHDDERLADDFNCSVSQVRNLLALMDCAPEIQRSVDAGEMSQNVARTLAVLPREEQKTKFEEMKATGALAGKEAKASAEEARGDRGRPPTPRKSMRRYKEVAGVIEQLEATAKDRPEARAEIRLLLSALKWAAGDDDVRGFGDVLRFRRPAKVA